LKSIVTLLSLVAIGYLLIGALLYLLQRNLLFFPVPARDGIPAEAITLKNKDLFLHGWVLNRGQQKALIYFGGNAEDITNNINLLESLFNNHTIYLIDYRGYGKNLGKPTQQGLFSDAIAIYDEILGLHTSISLMGRSLGSGVAVYLASKRDIDKLFLLTPYDSLAEVAQTHYPYFPVKYLIKDPFESIIYAKNINTPTLIVTAELDQVVPVKHAQKLRDQFARAKVIYHLITGAGHNNITSFPQYRQVIKAFIDSSS
jgi:pimeloyl-ACP methyl ester carboxylesterase